MGRHSAATAPLTGLQPTKDRSPVRVRDMSSAIARVSELIGEEPDRIPLDLAQIRDRLNAINPVANGISPKSFANIRSNLFAAITASRLKPIRRAQQGLTQPWRTLWSKLTTKRYRIGLSRLAHYGSAEGLSPAMSMTN
jgi:hypothetical protein